MADRAAGRPRRAARRGRPRAQRAAPPARPTQTGGWQPGDERFDAGHRPPTGARGGRGGDGRGERPACDPRAGRRCPGLLTAGGRRGAAGGRGPDRRRRRSPPTSSWTPAGAARPSTAGSSTAGGPRAAPRSGPTAASSTTGGTTAARLPAGVDAMLTHNDSVSLLTLPGGQRHLGGRHRPPARGTGRCGRCGTRGLGGGDARLPGHRGMDRRRADHRRLGDGGHRGPAAAVRRGRRCRS